MTEVARALVLPDFFSPAAEDLLSPLLIWEQLELDVLYVRSKDERQLTHLDGLLAEGLIRKSSNPLRLEETQPERPGDAPVTPALSDIGRAAKDYGLWFAQALLQNTSEAMTRASEVGLAPLAVTPLSQIAASLPVSDPACPVVEATMLQVASKGVRVSPDTPLEDVLLFRERNAALMGRFRASLIDLGASVEASTTVQAAEQAYAVLVNRIEPALADLATALDKGRIKFAVDTLLGATSVALMPTDPASKAVAGGALATRSLKYAFDKDRLVHDHPYGLLYRARQTFPDTTSSALPTQVTNPEAVLSRAFQRITHNVLQWVSQGDPEEAEDEEDIKDIVDI